MAAETRGSIYETSGGYGIRWLENGRRRFRSGFETKRDARRWFEDEVRPRLRGRRRESSSSTLAEFSETWLRAHAADVELGTITTLRYRLAHALETFGEVPLADLQRQALEIAAWRAALPERLRYPATSALQTSARRRGRMGAHRREPGQEGGQESATEGARDSPADGRGARTNRGRDRCSRPARHLRRGDRSKAVRMARSRGRDVDRAARVLYVEREHVGHETKAYLKTTASRRSVPLTAKALDALEELPPRLDTALVFPAVRGGYLNLRNWRSREWDTAVESAGLAACKCGHLSGDHDHDCGARGCKCETFERRSSPPSPTSYGTRSQVTRSPRAWGRSSSRG
ncbi:hypothetical protein BH18ACT13_BH18ACT13_13620 [soil metagenome]